LKLFSGGGGRAGKAWVVIPHAKSHGVFKEGESERKAKDVGGE
jgi:hypothetical protein